LGHHIFCHLDNNHSGGGTDAAIETPVTRAPQATGTGKHNLELAYVDALVKAKDKIKIFIGLLSVEPLKPVRAITHSLGTGRRQTSTTAILKRNVAGAISRSSTSLS
jgi:hypothetical protein